MVHEYIEKIPGRREDSHKGDYGKVLVIAGSPGMTGAAYLASQGALLSGSGLVTCGVPQSLNAIMEVKLTEVMTLALPETQEGTISAKAKVKILDFAEKCDVIAIGPGLGRNKDIQTLINDLLEAVEIPVVLDADGINALEGRMEILTKREARTVITPHPGEMSRLMGKSAGIVQSNREEFAKSIAEVTGSVVCLKGHRTVVASPEGNTYINETGNSGMASGGTGDVLTGMIASFIGQGVGDYSAAVCAAYLHGLSGDIASEKKGQFSMIATDLLEYLPEAFKKAGI
ncbi:MAG: NAD(P)H-hydrate dehydratase [Candidatus Omnitrophica bacterium]|nr:NAD(P)H-hydrate dehydratase [Candidatus Omnitrophota bacterium]